MQWDQQRDQLKLVIEELEDLLHNKGKEYSSTEDCLANFKHGTDIGVTPEQKLWIFLDKHLSSIKTYIREGQVFSNEPIEGRINDAINYLFLLRCLIVDNKQKQTESSADAKEN
jgi:hypothetical protein